LSPHLFTRYVRPLIKAISQSNVECNIGGLFVDTLAYADDMVLLTPSRYAMQILKEIPEMWCIKLDIMCNTTKTMILKSKSRDRLIPDFSMFHY